MATAVTDNKTETTISSLLQEVAELRIRVSNLSLEIEKLELERYIFAPSHIVEEKLKISLVYKHKLDKDIRKLEILKRELRSLGHQW